MAILGGARASIGWLPGVLGVCVFHLYKSGLFYKTDFWVSGIAAGILTRTLGALRSVVGVLVGFFFSSIKVVSFIAVIFGP